MPGEPRGAPPPAASAWCSDRAVAVHVNGNPAVSVLVTVNDSTVHSDPQRTHHASGALPVGFG